MYGKWQRSTVHRDYKKSISELEKLDSLSLEDLKKVQKYIKGYPVKVREIEEENRRIRARNEQIAKENERGRIEKEQQSDRADKAWSEAYYQPVVDFLNQIEQRLMPHKLGALRSMLGDTVRAQVGGAYHYFPSSCADLINQYDETNRKLSYIRKGKPPRVSYEAKSEAPLKKVPMNYSVLTIGGGRLRVFYRKFQLPDIEAHIASKEAELAKNKFAIQEIKARAAKNEAETRNQAKQFRNDLVHQLKKVPCCPYCAGPLSTKNAHLDHIYPVAKGGQSIQKNLVFVCASCNIKKRKHTLRNFTKETGLDFERLSHRLESLGKDF